ncbi:AlpA family phage regulatory protein [Rhizobium leguminosarum bv. viciae]|jgi:predicted DNA-binding transcriptional regulator AlpA|uniref:helix-turn-helix transcriptional regulator n=1 Tax=Rhizobium leguminosarum TaxID=384 RepID=UPI00103E3F27|nr:AlpA family phage regulatory protein [Rhizobium leguminosarum bv. viciae]NKL73948.1 AlpA family phage regulatory protein [Rhizobium leguminosarum bv. viciae]NKL83751.1 AlpA family phage regulatory protein [Rhizobium leguminosarum bv. viciae]TCA52742.1 AlpA family phage regulatory protein [Rhizobium leguminosarum bv. viciae]
MVRIIDINEVIRRTGVCRSTIWRNRKDKSSDFPPCRRLSKGRIGWPDVRIDQWILSKPVRSSRGRRRRRLITGRW